jgi:hypothetical protein
MVSMMTFAAEDEDMESISAWTGWVSYTSGPGGKDHLPPEVRAEVDRRERSRESAGAACSVVACCQPCWQQYWQQQGRFHRKERR